MQQECCAKRKDHTGAERAQIVGRKRRAQRSPSASMTAQRCVFVVPLILFIFHKCMHLKACINDTHIVYGSYISAWGIPSLHVLIA